MKKSIHVLHLISSSNIGGSPQHTLLLCEELLKAGHYPVLVYPSGGSYEDNYKQSGIKVYPLQKMSLFSPSLYLKLIDIIQKENIDIIHTHELKCDFIGFWTARFAGIPIVTTIHNMITHSRLSPLKKRIYCWISQYLYNSMDKVLAVSEAVKKNLIDELNVRSGKISTILNGTRKVDDLSVFLSRSEILEKSGIDSKSFIIISPGRLIPIQKGFEYLIQAIPGVLANHPDIHLLIVGDGIIRKDLEQLAAILGISGNVSFTGWRDDTQALLYASDICVVPSLWDPLPRTILESMMVGTPVIASRVDGIIEAINHGEDGLLVHPASAEELTDAMNYMIDNPKLIYQFGLTARNKALRKFTSERHAMDTVKIYQDCLKER